MAILDTLAGGRFSLDAGTAATITVAAGLTVTSISCHATGAGTLTITPGGANQKATAQTAIPIPAGTALTLDGPSVWSLGAGAVFVFAGTDSFVVTYARLTTGGP